MTDTATGPKQPDSRQTGSREAGGEQSRRPFAVVTGASSGIGAELARTFADNGYDLLICAEDDGIRSAGQALEAGGAEVTAVRVDLATPAGVEQLYAAIRATGRGVDAAALNAGIGLGGAFVDNDLDTELRMIDLNVRSTVHLAKLVLRDMVARRAGRVLVTSSIASTMPGSYQAVYNASKSFLQSFTQAVGNELKGTGVSLTALMPGPTATNFFSRAGMQSTLIGRAPKADPAQVARQGYEALTGEKTKVVAGSLVTKAQGVVNKVLPDVVKTAVHRKVAEPRS